MTRLEQEWGKLALDPDREYEASQAGEAVGLAAKAVDKFLADLILSGQTVNKVFREAVQKVTQYGGGAAPSRELLRKALWKHLTTRSPWGNDKMTPLLLDLILDGEYVL